MISENKKLGRGLGALLSSGKNEKNIQNFKLINISEIKANKDQPRKDFKKEELEELASSIKSQGVLQPIVVRKKAEEQYEIIAGERRWRGAQIAGLHEIPALVKEMTDNEAREAALIENIQREDLNAIEQAKAYQYLKDNLNSSITEIAKTVGKSRPAVSNSLRLLNLPLEIQDSILKNEINAGQARAILQKKTSQGMILLWKRLLKEKMSVRKVEAAASNNTKWDQQIKQIETNIARIIGTKVSISNNKKTKKGFVKIHFDSKTWDRVISKLKSVKSDFE